MKKRVVIWLLAVILTATGCKAPGPASGNAESVAAGRVENYLEEYAPRYAAFEQKHRDMAYRDVLVAVNLKLDQPNYSDVVIVRNPKALTVLVNKHYALPRAYRPDDLVAVDRKYAQSGVTLRADCCRAFLSMAKDMEAEHLQLYIKAGYRVNSKRGGTDSLWYAWPGHSEHQTGLAFDLRKKGVTHRTLSEYAFEKTREYAWLCKNAYQYGFVLSYPQGKSVITSYGFEPWHWRYIGADAAADMRSKGFLTYQEYWATCLIQDAPA